MDDERALPPVEAEERPERAYLDERVDVPAESGKRLGPNASILKTLYKRAVSARGYENVKRASIQSGGQVEYIALGAAPYLFCYYI